MGAFTSSGTYGATALGAAFFSQGTAIADGQFEVGVPGVSSLVFGATTNYFVKNPQDVYSHNVRANDQPRLGVHGDSAGYDLLGARQIVMQVMIKGSSIAALQANIENWKKFFSPVNNVVVPLRWKIAGVSTRYLVFGRPRRFQLDTTTMGARFAMGVQEFICHDPRIYADNLQQFDYQLTDSISYVKNPEGTDAVGNDTYNQPWTAAPSFPLIPFQNNPTGILIGGAGTINAPIYWGFVGPLKNPTIIDQATNNAFSFTFELPSGAELIVDTDAHSVMYNGIDNWRNTLQVVGPQITTWPVYNANGIAGSYYADRFDTQNPSLRIWLRAAYL